MNHKKITNLQFVLVYIFGGAFLSALLFIPGINLAKIIYSFPLPFRIIGKFASFILTYFIIIAFFIFIIWIFHYFIENFHTYAERMMNRLGLIKMEWLLLIASIVMTILIPFTAPYYIGLTISFFLIFLSLVLSPIIERDLYQPEPIIVPEPPQPIPVVPPQPQPISPPKPEIPDDFEERTYEWDFPLEVAEGRLRFKKEFLRILINKKEFEEKRRKNPTKEENFGTGVLKELIENGISREVVEVASHIRNSTINEMLCDYLEILNAVSFTQEAIKYLSDKESVGLEEYWKYPIETLYDKNGDCECKSILAVAILKILGKDTVFILLPGHMAIGISGADGFPEGEGFRFLIYRGKKYFYCEVTAEGWLPGQVPSDFNLKEAEIISV